MTTSVLGCDVLVVDDDGDIRATVMDVLRLKGFAVEGASDGRAALDSLRAGLRPGLVLLDLMMPRMNGWELRAEMAADPELASIPIVVLTSGADPAGLVGLDAAGVLKKPIRLQTLIETVARHRRSA